MIEREYYALFIKNCDDEFAEDEMYIIFFPDFGNATQADTELEGIKYAKELLELTVNDMQITDIPAPRPKESLADIFVVEVPYHVKKDGTISAKDINEASVPNTLVAHIALMHSIRYNKEECDIIVAELCGIDLYNFEKSFECGLINPIDVPKLLHDEIQSYLDGKSQKVIHEFSDGESCIKFIPIPVFLQPDRN